MYYLHVIYCYQSLIAVVIHDLEMCYLPFPALDDSGHVKPAVCFCVYLFTALLKRLGSHLITNTEEFIMFQWYTLRIRDGLGLIILGSID